MNEYLFINLEPFKLCASHAAKIMTPLVNLIEYLFCWTNFGPTTLTYNTNLAKVNVDLHTEYQGRRSNGSGMRVLTDGRTLPSTLSPCFAKLRGR